MKAKKEFVRQLIESLNNEPTKWQFDKYEARNSQWSITLSISNGMYFLRVVEPYEINFSFFQKIRLRKAINKCKAVKLLRETTKTEE